MSILQSAKLWVMGATGLSKDALHVYAGLTVFFGVAALLRVPLASPRPWLAVALGAVVIELWDLGDTMVFGAPVVLRDNWHDVWNTLFWPSVIVLLARFTRVLRR